VTDIGYYIRSRYIPRESKNFSLRHRRFCDAKKIVSFDGGDSGSKKCKRGYCSAYGGVWQSLRLAGFLILESGGRFCVSAFGVFSRREDVLTFNSLYFMNKFYTFCTLNTISKDNAVINVLLFNTKKFHSRQL
jgi:hypothetical protein